MGQTDRMDKQQTDALSTFR